MNRTTANEPTLTSPSAAEFRQARSRHRTGPFGGLAAFGPAIVASVAYLDPGNIVTNLQAGAKYGDELIWVVLAASIVAMLFQSMSAKLGIVTGRNLAEICRETLPRRYAISLWLICEAAAMATDLAEIIGSSIGISLLFHITLFGGLIITVAVTCGLLQLEKHGYRPLELVICGFVGIIGLSYLAEVSVLPVHWASVLRHSAPSRFSDHGALDLAVGIVGATIMPHTLFLHSSLTQSRIPTHTVRERRRLLRISNIEVVCALGAAGVVNVAMVVVSSVAFHHGHQDTADLASATQLLTPLFGVFAGSLFLIALITSGISSSVVGTMAGQVIVQGFVGFPIPWWVRRGITIIPTVCIILSGVDVTRALVASQVMLSIALPAPMITLIWFTARRDLMGGDRNRLSTNMTAIVSTALVLGLNALLIWQSVYS
jgi:manganese transport protein